MTTTYAACPRCAGRLHEETDYYGRHLTCVNCGFLEALDGYDPEGKRDARQSRAARQPPRHLRGLTYKQRNR